MTEQAVMQDARRYWAMLHKRRGIVLTCFGVSLAVAVLYNYTTRPVYRATTQILIDRDTPNVLPNKELVELVQGGMDYYQTQYQLLKGRSLAERAVERLKLQRHPELATGPMMNPWERVRGFFGRPPSAVVDQSGMPLSPAAAAFRSRIDVDPLPGSRLVNLHFRAYDPQVAADAVNMLAQLYIEQSLELRYTTSTEATGWLSERLTEQQAKVETAEKALQEYREREGLVNQEERQGLVEQKLEMLNGAVLDARTDRIAKESLYNQIAAQGPGQIESFPLVLGSEPVQALKAELALLQKEEARLAETLGDRHPDMVRVRAQIRSTEEKIRAEMRNVARAAESEYRTALAKEARLAATLEAVKKEALETNRKSIEYGVLKREVETNRQLYQDLLTKTKQTGLETELKTTNIRVVEKAERPRGPLSPNKMRNYQVAIILGLLVGIGLALGFEHLDNTFKTPEDVKEHLQVPFLGMVPDVGLKSARGARARAERLAGPQEPELGGGRRLPRAAHEPHLHLGGDDGPGDPGDEREPGRGQDDDPRQPRDRPRPERGEGAGGGRRPAPAHAQPPLRPPEDAGPLRPDRGQGRGVPGDPVDTRQRPAAPGLRLPAAEPGGAAGLADDEAGPRRVPRALRLGADRRAAAPRHGRRAGALRRSSRGWCWCSRPRWRRSRR